VINVARYRVETGLLNEAGEDFSSLAAEIDKYKERADSVLSQGLEGHAELRVQLAASKESLSEISRKSRSFGFTVYDIIDSYTRAERNAMGGHHRDSDSIAAMSQAGILPNIRRSSGAVFIDRTVLPDWLQMAVLEYERAKGN
jgi:hypothetical protein